MFVLIFSLASFGEAYAHDDDDDDDSDDDDEFEYEYEEEGVNGKEKIKIKSKIVDGIRKVEFKKAFKMDGENGNYEIKSKLEVKGLSGEKGKAFLEAILSDGSHQEIEVLPEVARMRAREKLKIGEGEEEIEIREEIHNNVPRAVYHFNSNKQGKFLGLWKIKARYEASIDPETGEVLDYKGPWWTFLLTGEDREYEDDKGKDDDHNETDDDSDDDNNETDNGDDNNQTNQTGGDNNNTNNDSA